MLIHTVEQSLIYLNDKYHSLCFHRNENQTHYLVMFEHHLLKYRIHDLYGGDFNFAVWQIL